MPCMKCSNGKYKYGAGGDCVFDTLETCHQAAAAIHIQNAIPPDPKNPPIPEPTDFYTNNPNGHMTIEDMYNQANTRW